MSDKILTLTNNYRAPYMFAFIRFISLRFPPGCVLLAGATMAAGETGMQTGLAVSGAAEISFPTKKGKVYQLQASEDLKSWPDVGDAVYGTGDLFQQWVSAKSAAATKQFFRLKEITRPAGGLAPWEISNIALQFNEGERAVKYEFGAEGAGFWKSGEVTKAFKWEWMRSGLNAGLVTVKWPDGGRENLKLEFTAALLGRFDREEWTGDRLEDTDSGTFGAIPSQTTALLPQVLNGRHLAFSDSGSVTALKLGTQSTGTRTLEKVERPMTYSWLITGNGTVTLNTNFSPTHGEEYKLSFSSPQTGKFVRKTFTEGIWRDEDSGVFTLSALP